MRKRKFKKKKKIKQYIRVLIISRQTHYLHRIIFIYHITPQCNITITNFLVSHTCEIRCNDVIGPKHFTYVFLRKISKTWLTDMAKWVCFGPLLFNLIRWIQLCDKKNLTFVDCCHTILHKLVLKNFIKLAKSSLNNNFQDSFNKIWSQWLTHDRSYMPQTRRKTSCKTENCL